MSDAGDKAILDEVEDLRRQKYIWTFGFFHACDVQRKLAEVALDALRLVSAFAAEVPKWTTPDTDGDRLAYQATHIIQKEADRLLKQLHILGGR